RLQEPDLRSTAARRRAPDASGFNIRPEPYALARIAAADPDRRAIGTPARRSREGAVLTELYGIHPAADTAPCPTVMPAIPQPCQHVGGHALLHLHREALGPQTRRLHRLLHIHAVIDQVGDRLHHRGEDP